MALFAPNFFVERGPWTEIAFGSGAPVKAALTKIDGVSTKHKWKEQKSKEKSGSVNVFSGTEWGHPELTFTATDDADFDELRALWDLMHPVPGQGSGTPAAATPAPGQTFAIGSPAKADTSSSTGGAAADPADTSAKKTDAKDDPGPRPPTIAVRHPLLAWHAITACALEEWTGPTPTETNGLEVKIKIIPDKPQTPAGTGAMAAPAPGSQFAAGGGSGAGGAAGGGAAGGAAGSMNTNAAAGAAGT